MIARMLCFVALWFISGVAVAQSPDVPFSHLPPERQQALRAAAEPPPLAERTGPYSVPMYYLMHSGYEYLGDEDRDPDGRCYPSMKGKAGPDFGRWKLDRNRPDFQEAMVANWAELGLNSTHLNIYPQDGKLALKPEYAKAVEDYVALCGKYGLRVGVRLDALDETKLWSVHPRNPESKRSQYLEWAADVARLLKGRTAYYVLGDELTLKKPEDATDDRAWTAEMYLDYFRQVSAAIKAVDPGAKVCMFAASSGEWFNVLWLLEHGYGQLGDGVAINHYDYTTVGRFFADRDRLAPGKLFLTSGVGYISNGTVKPRYPEGDAYSPARTEQEHAARIAKTMFTWWDLGADTAPYYLNLRNWVVDGKTYPRWFGFFGFEDYVIEDDTLRVKRYPGWYAYQAIANTFYNRQSLRALTADAIKSSSPLTTCRAFERDTPAGKQIVAMLWNDGDAAETTISFKAPRFGHPVKVSLANFRDWADLPAEIKGDTVHLRLKVGPEPVILRLFEQ